MWGVRKIPWRRETPPTPVFWPREFHGVYTPWGHKESDKIWWLINNTEASPFVRDNNSIYTTVCMFSGSYVSNSCSPVAPKILSLWNFSGKNTAARCHFLLQGFFPTQCFLRILHWQADYLPEPPGKRKKKKVKLLSCVQLFATPWTVAYQAPPSMGFSRQEYWSGLPFPSPGDLPDPGIEPGSPALEADTLISEPPGKPPAQNSLQKTKAVTHFYWKNGIK